MEDEGFPFIRKATNILPLRQNQMLFPKPMAGKENGIITIIALDLHCLIW